MSECTNLIIHRYFNFNGIRSCNRLRELCFARKNFISIENPDDNYGTMQILLKRFYSTRRTQSLRITSRSYPNAAYRSSLSPSLIVDTLRLSPTLKAQFNALTHLSLIRQRFDGRLIRTINVFPNTLKVLHLSGTELSHIRDESFWFKVSRLILICPCDLRRFHSKFDVWLVGIIVGNGNISPFFIEHVGTFHGFRRFGFELL